MKKAIVLILIMVTIIILGNDEYNLTDDAIRFRIIANSNSSKDILMKELVVEKISKILFKDNDNIADTRNNIISNIEKVDNEVKKLFLENDYDMTYNIRYGMNEFPEKEYNKVKFKAESYESLVIEIGEAKGNNYWCILYPPLCMVGDNKSEEKVIYKSKIIELIKSLL